MKSLLGTSDKIVRVQQMSLSPVKRLVLEMMWHMDRPAKAKEIAKEVGLAFPPVMMHILGLAKMGYAETVEKGTYTITETGREALGLPPISKEKAAEILAYLPVDKSFHFYADIGKPLNIYAASLGDFCDKLAKTDASSLEFHLNRGDFEAWFASLGDTELTKRTLLLRERKVLGEELRNRLCQNVKNRCNVLTKIRNQQPTNLA
jgi:hypothetical protein